MLKLQQLQYKISEIDKIISTLNAIIFSLDNKSYLKSNILYNIAEFKTTAYNAFPDLKEDIDDFLQKLAKILKELEYLSFDTDIEKLYQPVHLSYNNLTDKVLKIKTNLLKAEL